MEILSNTIQTTLESFDFAFCIIVNVLTYLIIRLINDRNVLANVISGMLDINKMFRLG